MEKLTFCETLFLKELTNHINLYGYTPTVREFGRHMGLNSPATVHYYLKNLQKKGYIKRVGRRDIQILT